MKWSKGMVLAAVTHNKYHGVIQQLEGLPNLFVQVETPEKECVIEENLHDWSEAEKWVERKIYELAAK
jgi:hypothetical protein